AFNIVRYTISERQEKLLFDSRQMATLSDMGGKVKYITDSRPYFKYDTMRPTYVKIATGIYDIGITAGVWKTNIYDVNDNLMAFTIIEEKGSSLGYVHNKDNIEMASLKPNEELTRESWLKQDSLPEGIEYHFSGTISSKEEVHFRIIGDSLSLVASVPIMAMDYNSVTEKMEAKRIGTIVSVQKLDTAFVNKMSELSGVEINLFAADALVAGTYTGYKKFDLSKFEDVEHGDTLATHTVMFNSVDLADGSYFQGILPIYHKSECVAAIVSLYSKDIARANTVQIIKLLSLVYLVGILLIVPITILVVVRGIINPIARIASMMRDIAHKKDFTKVLNIERQDEIGDLASSFNEMTADLKKSTTSIDNLNKEIAERKQAQEELSQLLSLHTATLEATADGILVVDLEGRVVSRNQKFIQLWCIPDNIAETKDDKKLLSHVLEQLVDPEEFLAEVKRLYSNPEEQSFDILNFKDGRVFERYSQPHRIGEKIVGRVWSFSDVTERKRAEAELHEAHEQLIETAHKAGMAEVATDVLHNVGNVLNSINVSTSLLTEKVSKSKVMGLEKVANIINEHVDDLGTFLAEDPQGKHIPVYLAEVSKLLNNEHAEILSTLRTLSENVEHVKNIVGMQQSYAKVSGVAVSVSLAELVEDAIQINIAGLERHGAVLKREFDELPDVEIDKQKVLQIVVNLINNAKYAVTASSKEDKLITIRTYKHNENSVRIEVSDNGIGITEENLTKIFNHGFTTKQRGHGFGLHSGALAAVELGGTLTARSDGVEQGAMFTLELPFKPIKVKQ
ncbi:MAG: ATP-binding protein, partial [Phycisphaerales bacterium]